MAKKTSRSSSSIRISTQVVGLFDLAHDQLVAASEVVLLDREPLGRQAALLFEVVGDAPVERPDAVAGDRAVREVDGGPGDVAHLGDPAGRQGAALLDPALARRRPHGLDELALDVVEDAVRADDVEQVEDVRRQHREAERHQQHREQRRDAGDVRPL